MKSDKTQKLQQQIGELQNELLKVGKKVYGPDWTPLPDSSENEEALKLCDTVLEYVPEFKEFRDFSIWDNNGKEAPYFHFGNFGNFLVEQIESTEARADEIIRKSFDFINDSYNATKEELIRSIFITEIFETLTISPHTKATAQNLLKDAALDQFNRMV